MTRNNPPDWLTNEEEKLLSTIIEATIDFSIEQKHIHELTTDESE